MSAGPILERNQGEPNFVNFWNFLNSGCVGVFFHLES